MDEDCTEEYITPTAKSHDRWSVLIAGLSWGVMVADATAQTLQSCAIMAAQHSNQKMYNNKFFDIMKGL